MSHSQRLSSKVLIKCQLQLRNNNLGQNWTRKYTDIKLLYSTTKLLHQNVSGGMKKYNPTKNLTPSTGLRRRNLWFHHWLSLLRNSEKRTNLKMNLKLGKHKSSKKLKSKREMNTHPRRTRWKFKWWDLQQEREVQWPNQIRRILRWMTLVRGMISLWGASRVHSIQR